MKINIKTVSQQPITKIDLFNSIATNKFFKDVKYPSIEEKINLISKWQDLKPMEVEKMHVNTINGLFKGINTTVLTYQSNKPKERIKNLTHRTDYLDFTAGHWKHIETVDFTSRPSMFMALFYIEEGLHYGYEEKKGGVTKVVNPVSERAKLINKESNLSELIDLLTFFLNISELLKKPWVLSLNKSIQKMRETKKKNKTRMFSSEL